MNNGIYLDYCVTFWVRRVGLGFGVHYQTSPIDPLGIYSDISPIFKLEE